jgi:hypothetical protein
MACIYGLYDASGKLRYIGKANDPAKRLKSHLRDSARRNTPLYAWVRKHGVPEMRVIVDHCEDWRADERRLIAEHRANGRLLNLADGGDQPKSTKAQLAKAGQAAAIARQSTPTKRRFWELKRALGHLLRDGAVSERTKGKMRAAAVSRPDLFGAWASI